MPGRFSYNEFTEYGAPRAASSAFSVYAWLGNEQRAIGDLGGLTLMGVRLYNSTTGRFLSVDPIYGGNKNSYVYTDDPIQDFDLDGRFHWYASFTYHLSHKDAQDEGRSLVHGANFNDVIFAALGYIPGVVNKIISSLGGLVDEFLRDLGNRILEANKGSYRGVKVRIGMGTSTWWEPIPYPHFTVTRLGGHPPKRRGTRGSGPRGAI